MTCPGLILQLRWTQVHARRGDEQSPQIRAAKHHRCGLLDRQINDLDGLPTGGDVMQLRAIEQGTPNAAFRIHRQAIGTTLTRIELGENPAMGYFSKSWS